MRIIVAGCSSISACLAKDLSDQKHDITVIAEKRSEFESKGFRFQGKFVEGVPFDREALELAGIGYADALAAVDGREDANLVAALIARQEYHVPNVAALVWIEQKAQAFYHRGIATVSPFEPVVHHLTDILTFSHLSPLLELGNGQIVILRVLYPSDSSPRAVSAFNVPDEIHIVVIERNGRANLALPNFMIQPGDQVILSVTRNAVERVRRIFD